MPATKADIIAQLQKEILPLQGYRSALNNSKLDSKLGPVKLAFPNKTFPLGAVHEFLAAGPEDAAASAGFLSVLLSSLMQDGGVVLWIGRARRLFPIALKSFGIEPDKIIFIDLQKEKDVLWAMEEALKCEGLAAVVGELPELSFTDSRRLQLAVEQSRVTGFLLRCSPKNLSTTACVTRWKINSLPSIPVDDMPGLGFPRWNVSLLKVRNGKPGSWDIEWIAGKLRNIPKISLVPAMQNRKTG